MTLRLCITGTDTDVGKSVVTAALAAGFRARGLRVVAAKPIASGVRPGTHGEDAERIAAAAGHPPLTWARFVRPVSPHRAQAEQGVALDPADLRRWLDDLVGDVVLVEAAGGWRVPLFTHPAGTFEAVHLARHLGGATLVVAANRLGVLNHTLLTVDAIRRDGLDVVGIALNQASPGSDESSATNLNDLRSLTDRRVAAVPHLAPIDPTIPTGSQLVHDLGL